MQYSFTSYLNEFRRVTVAALINLLRDREPVTLDSMYHVSVTIEGVKCKVQSILADSDQSDEWLLIECKVLHFPSGREVPEGTVKRINDQQADIEVLTMLWDYLHAQLMIEPGTVPPPAEHMKELLTEIDLFLADLERVSEGIDYRSMRTKIAYSRYSADPDAAYRYVMLSHTHNGGKLLPLFTMAELIERAADIHAGTLPYILVKEGEQMKRCYPQYVDDGALIIAVSGDLFLEDYSNATAQVFAEHTRRIHWDRIRPEDHQVITDLIKRGKQGPQPQEQAPEQPPAPQHQEPEQDSYAVQLSVVTAIIMDNYKDDIRAYSTSYLNSLHNMSALAAQFLATHQDTDWEQVLHNPESKYPDATSWDLWVMYWAGDQVNLQLQDDSRGMISN